MSLRLASARAIATAVAAALLVAVSGCSTPPPSAPSLMVVTVPDDAATLEAAVDAVAPGGMILLKAGVYFEQVVVDKPDVTIRGLDRNATIIDGEAIRPYGIVGIADGVRIENLTVRNTTFYGVLVTGLHDENGPSAHNGSGYTTLDPEAFPPLQRFSINYVTAYNNGLYGIYAFDAQHGSITNSFASGSADSGFYVGQCPDCDILVSGNVAENNAVGFENANASLSLTVVGNRFSNNRVGMTLTSNYLEAFTPQSANVVAGNVLSGNTSSTSPAQESGGYGIGLGISGGQSNVVANNRIEGNPRAGVVLANTEDLPALDNVFSGNAFSANGVDLANVSAVRTPASGNCVEGETLPTTVPEQLLADCASGIEQPAIGDGALPGGSAPAGISFLEVPPPADQPTMPNPTRAPSVLPDTVERPLADDVSLPPADLFAELTRRP